MIRGGFRVSLFAINSLVLLFVLSPLIVVVVSSFGETRYMRFPPQGLTLSWYVKALGDTDYWQTFRTSVFVGGVCALAATLIGAAAAWALVRYRIRGRTVLESVFLLPLTLPHLILGIALLVLTQPMGFGNTIWRLVAAHVVITIPYVLRVLLPVISQLRLELEEAAADLGATPLTVMRTLTIPLLMQPVLMSSILAFMVSFDELILALFLAPPSDRTLPMQIYSNVEFELDPTVGAVSTMLLGATVLVMVIANAISRLGPGRAFSVRRVGE